jgi:predicted amidohydrolase YtcJ
MMMKRIILFVVASLLAACTPGTVSTPTQALDYTIRVELTSTTVWADLRIQNEQDVISAELVAVSGDPTYQDASPGGQAIDQPSSAVDTGNEVSITVDYKIKAEASERGLSFRLQRDIRNGCTVRIYHLVGEEARLVYELNHQDEIGLDEKNTIDFTLDLNKMVVFLTEVPPEALQPGDDSASIIFHNGVILTMEAEPLASAIAVKGEYILAVGSDEDMLAYAGPGTKLIDLDGRTLMPGFVDAHTHILNDANRYLDGVDYEEAQQLALMNGITTLGDMYVTPEFLAEMRNLDDSGGLLVRTSLYLIYTTPCGEVQGDWYMEYPPTRESGEMLRIGGVKVFTDGGACGIPAMSYYRPNLGYGDLWFTQSELNAIVADIDSAGYQVAIHALGDRALEQALNAIEFALDGRANTLRHRIEHNATIRPELIPRYQEIGVVATVFGSFPSCSLYSVPAEYQTWNWPYRDLLDGNPDVHFAWHSDFPYVGPAAPLLHLYSMVTPYEIISDDMTECEDPAWLPRKSLTLDQALPMMTIESAYALFRDEEVGSLEPGKYADLIILSGNPTMDIYAIKNLQVWMTMVGGNVEYCAQGHEAMCP